MTQITPGNLAARPACVGGLYEICVGVPDLAASIAYYERFGCHAGRFGTLDASAARALYGVDSALRSVRLQHQDADHGLVRLMHWERPVNPPTTARTGSIRRIGSPRSRAVTAWFAMSRTLAASRTPQRLPRQRRSSSRPSPSLTGRSQCMSRTRP